MPLDLDKRLANLRKRRIAEDDDRLDMIKSVLGAPVARKVEAYQRRSSEKALSYALGAMQEVDPEYTRATIAEGNRVVNQLSSNVPSAISFEYQGSVPLNLHIKWVSDVDLLVLPWDWVCFDWSGPASGSYVHLGGSPVRDLLDLRASCETALVRAFPAATVNTDGAKSICISGGSLRRTVDVVPAYWFDTATYQATRDKRHRHVMVVNKYTLDTLRNRPFMHMALVNEKDAQSGGGAKKVIRLLKNLINDSDYDIKLTSYDVTCLVWYFDSVAMSLPVEREIGLLDVALRHLRYFAVNDRVALELGAPDGSRKILDEPSKFQSLRYLTSDLEELAIEAARELDPLTRLFPTTVPRVLAEARV